MHFRFFLIQSCKGLRVGRPSWQNDLPQRRENSLARATFRLWYFSYQTQTFVLAISSDDAGDGPDEQPLSAVYVNAEGKANCTHQLKVILETVKSRRGSSWLFIFVSEADFRGRTIMKKSG